MNKSLPITALYERLGIDAKRGGNTFDALRKADLNGDDALVMAAIQNISGRPRLIPPDLVLPFANLLAKNCSGGSDKISEKGIESLRREYHVSMNVQKTANTFSKKTITTEEVTGSSESMQVEMSIAKGNLTVLQQEKDHLLKTISDLKDKITIAEDNTKAQSLTNSDALLKLNSELLRVSNDLVSVSNLLATANSNADAIAKKLATVSDELLKEKGIANANAEKLATVSDELLKVSNELATVSDAKNSIIKAKESELATATATIAQYDEAQARRKKNSNKWVTAALLLVLTLPIGFGYVSYSTTQNLFKVFLPEEYLAPYLSALVQATIVAMGVIYALELFDSDYQQRAKWIMLATLSMDAVSNWSAMYAKLSNVSLELLTVANFFSWQCVPTMLIVAAVAIIIAGIQYACIEFPLKTLKTIYT
jgi:hypothetical protein